jgi:hypothetical protein
MTLIRPRQRAITALRPHNANRRFLIPKRLFHLTEAPGFDGVYTVTVSSNPDNYAGYGSAGVPAVTQFGTIVPQVTVGGDPILAFFAAPSNYLVFVWGAGSGIDHGIESVTVVIDAQAPAVLRFDGYGYTGLYPALRTYLVSKVGSTVSVTGTVQP